MSTHELRIGCAGWSLSRGVVAEFPAQGTHLERYAARFSATEINSSFYRPHKRQTYERWAAAVPSTFRFSVKVPKSISHERRLVDTSSLLATFLEEVGGLQEKLGCLLIQLPPKFDFALPVAESFLRELRTRYDGAVALEARHATWFSAEVLALLAEFRISRVAADPAPIAAAAVPAGHASTVYFRWHGSPRIYFSSYNHDALASLAAQVEAHQTVATSVWCIFDNTASSSAVPNGLELTRLVRLGQ